MKFITVASLLLAGSTAIALPQQQGNTESTAAQGKLYEVVITRDVNRADLRRIIEAVENDFYDRFNELNADDAFDINCSRVNPTMSHISQRECLPNFITAATSKNASDVGSSISSGSFGDEAVLSPAAIRNQQRENFAILEQKMKDLTRSDQEFREIGNALAELKARLESL